MQSPRKIAVPAYMVAAVLVLFPLLDAALTIWPPQPGAVTWRFGAVGLLSRAVMTPLLGLLVAFALALWLEQRRVLRALAVLSGIVTVCLLGAMALFVLDAIQVRSQVRVDAKTAFDAASLVALGKYGAVLLATLGFAIGGWKAARGGPSPRRAREGAAPAGLIQVAGRSVPSSGAAPVAGER